MLSLLAFVFVSSELQNYCHSTKFGVTIEQNVEVRCSGVQGGFYLYPHSSRKEKLWQNYPLSLQRVFRIGSHKTILYLNKWIHWLSRLYRQVLDS